MITPYQVVHHLDQAYFFKGKGHPRYIRNISPYGMITLERAEDGVAIHCHEDDFDKLYSRFPQTEAVGGCKE